MNIFLGAYTSTAVYDANTDVRPIPYSQTDIASLAAQENLHGLRAAIIDLTAYESAVRKYYDNRVNRTSGGKRDRMRRERADLTNEALAAIRLATIAIASVEASIVAKTKASLPAYDDSPAMNAALRAASVDAGVSPASSSLPGNATSLMLVAAAGVAALLLLKG